MHLYETSLLSHAYAKVQKRVDNGISLKAAIAAVVQSNNSKSVKKLTVQELEDYYDSKQVPGDLSTSQPGMMGYS